MNKDRFEKILEISGVEDGLVVNSSDALLKFIARIDAERGKEAELNAEYTRGRNDGWEAAVFKYKTTTIPEGMALEALRRARNLLNCDEPAAALNCINDAITSAQGERNVG